jgi:hypothetical protein
MCSCFAQLVHHMVKVATSHISTAGLRDCTLLWGLQYRFTPFATFRQGLCCLFLCFHVHNPGWLASVCSKLR